MKFKQKKIETVEAWRYDPNEPAPVWVVQKCHYLGDGKFTANSIMGVLPVTVGDYIIRMEDGEEFVGVVVVDGPGFLEYYEPTS